MPYLQLGALWPNVLQEYIRTVGLCKLGALKSEVMQCAFQLTTDTECFQSVVTGSAEGYVYESLNSVENGSVVAMRIREHEG